jgi:tRNA(Ile)-lysidine synthase TilS/MesJ
MEFSMLGPGDRCLVGLSGGKDSAFLLYALAALRQTAPFQFDLAAATIDPMFDPNFPADRLRQLCESLGVPFFLEQSNFAQLAFAPSEQNPCPRCAYFRRGALNRIAKREGYNRLALAHHHDDAVETFLMSILYAGQIKTFTPVTQQERSELLVIRPLIYLRESQIRATSFSIGNRWPAAVPWTDILLGRL